MALQLKPISEQVIVITGASSGIGLATALSAAEKGAKVVLTARSEDALRSTVNRIHADGGKAISVVADVANRSEVQNVALVALREFGHIDTWVNDAGVSIYGRLDEVSDEDNRRLFDVNFWGVVNGSLTALPHLRASHGALINVGSEVSDAVVPLQGMYSASKHAVKGFTDALRVELEQVDKAELSITLIQPTAVDTPYPQHARNYMDKEPKLPEPMIEAQKVADAILHAAEHPERDVKVGLGSKLNTLMSKLLPSVADKMSGKLATEMQYQEPPRDPEGTLNKPGEGGQVQGTGPRNEEDLEKSSKKRNPTPESRH